ncbi:hypothetical protein MMC12_006899 [Toensbergia leucococca]|nr:hypothetical protein [Toensbergia leucococca]
MSRRPLPCDQCHRRKVRCDGDLTCRRCFDANLNCTREIVRKRRGPKKGSGSIIARLRTTDSSLSNHTTPRPSSQPIVNKKNHFVTVNELAQHILNNDQFSAADFSWSSEAMLSSRSPTSPSVASSDQTNFSIPSPQTPDLPRRDAGLAPLSDIMTVETRDQKAVSPYSPHIYDSLPPPEPPWEINFNDEHPLSRYVHVFFLRLHQIMPILHEPSFRRLLTRQDHLQPRDKCLVLAVCSVTVLLDPGSTGLSFNFRKVAGQCLIQQCLQIRATFDYIEKASLATIQTSYLLSIALFEVKKPRSSWIHVREAITLAQELGMYDEDLSIKSDRDDPLCRQRTLFLLSLSERGSTILRNRPVTSGRFLAPPQGQFKGENPLVASSLQALGRLFGLLDEEFLSFWSMPISSQSDYQNQATENIRAIQHTLSCTTFESDSLLDAQKANILITQQWLRLIFWQAAMRQGLLSSNEGDPSLSYQYPLEIARCLCDILESIPTSPILLHGMGIVRALLLLLYSTGSSY